MAKNYYTPALSRAVSQEARRVKRNKYHVIIGLDKRWKLIGEGKQRSTRVFNTQYQAVNFAKAFIRNHHGEVIVHTYTGQVREVISTAQFDWSTNFLQPLPRKINP